jgi:hypothetical protein
MPAMEPPPLLSTLPAPIRVQIAVVGPLLFGAVCGFALGASALAYWLLSAVGLGAAVAGGFEHLGARAGAIRGLVAGCLFGVAFLGAHVLSGQEPQIDVPDPLALVALVSALIGMLGGAAGGRARARRERR